MRAKALSSDIEAALVSKKGAAAGFDFLPPLHLYFLTWIDEAKKPVTRQKRMPIKLGWRTSGQV